jgi:hypothetical protein
MHVDCSRLLRLAIQTPARQIAINAGADGSVVVGKTQGGKVFTRL